MYYQNERCSQRELSTPDFSPLLKRLVRAVNEPNCRQLGRKSPEEQVVEPIGVGSAGMNALAKLRLKCSSRLSSAKTSSGSPNGREHAEKAHKSNAASKSGKHRIGITLFRGLTQHRTFIRPLYSAGGRSWMNQRTVATISMLMLLGVLFAQLVKAEPFTININGVDVAFEIAGENSAVESAVASVRPGGRVILAGIPGDDRTSFPASIARRKGLTLKLVRRMKHSYPRAIRLVESGRVDVRSLVTHTFPLERAAEAFRTAARREGLKVIVKC